MAIIKSHTDLQQSKKLAEILPLESADMRIGNYVGKSGKVDGTNVHYYFKGESFGAPEIIDAWSLAALLKTLNFPSLTQNKEDEWEVSVFDRNYDHYIEKTASNPVDTCYEMILYLKDKNLL
jgi:hypothetical protein